MGEVVGEHPSETAVKHRHRGAELPYEEFQNESGRFVDAIRRAGVKTDDRVTVYLPNLPEFVTSFVGVLRNGNVFVPLNPQYKPREIEHIPTDNGAKLVVTLPELVDEVCKIEDETDVFGVITVGGEAEGATEYEGLHPNPRLTRQAQAGTQPRLSCSRVPVGFRKVRIHLFLQKLPERLTEHTVLRQASYHRCNVPDGLKT